MHLEKSKDYEKDDGIKSKQKPQGTLLHNKTQLCSEDFSCVNASFMQINVWSLKMRRDMEGVA